ncbi:SDR family oxidoreductase [Oceanicoccus sp. KOV_DT_Chl]|uniref:SDR family oxidoreductase n=1 Tax=Oceanicoccus sp. KOV_DT_Chl TaxID=1904639 RepID=UPI00190E9C06|nr:SDR family oxidoreductase [Oceanicoccus sp. KOV_DT_Chl]
MTIAADQKVALVTGANRGIGYETARLLAKQGIHVLATARDAQKGQLLLERLDGEDLSISTFPYEASDPASAQALFKYVQKTYGRLDILVNNAGIAPDQWQSGFQLSTDVFKQVMEINVYAPLQLIQLFMPLMKQQGYGRIVNLSTELASLTNSEMGSTLAYRTSKGALNTLTKLLALELKEYPDIKINAAAPGWCKTALGGDDAPRSAEEGADTVVWLATLDDNGPSGGFYRDRAIYPW